MAPKFVSFSWMRLKSSWPFQMWILLNEQLYSRSLCEWERVCGECMCIWHCMYACVFLHLYCVCSCMRCWFQVLLHLPQDCCKMHNNMDIMHIFNSHYAIDARPAWIQVASRSCKFTRAETISPNLHKNCNAACRGQFMAKLHHVVIHFLPSTSHRSLEKELSPASRTHQLLCSMLNKFMHASALCKRNIILYMYM